MRCGGLDSRLSHRPGGPYSLHAVPSPLEARDHRLLERGRLLTRLGLRLRLCLLLGLLLGLLPGTAPPQATSDGADPQAN